MSEKKERLMMRVNKGGFIPADVYTQDLLRDRRYAIGDIVSADIRKPRNPKFNRLVHRIGALVVANIEAFAGLDSHTAIKRLQIEGRIACSEVGILVAGYGMVIQFIPRSMSFETMGEEEFNAAARGICRTIAERYWQTLTPEQIEEMAQSFVTE